MSLEAAMNFVAKMRDDEKIADQVLDAVVGKDIDTAAAAFVALGKAQGFTFSAEDAVVVYQRATALEQQRAASGEMSGLDLDRVSGGGNLKREGMGHRGGPGSGGGVVAPPSNPVSSTGGMSPTFTKPMPSFTVPSIKISSY